MNIYLISTLSPFQAERGWQNSYRRIVWIHSLWVQGYPQMMRLQRRLYGIFLSSFLAFRVPCRLIFLINHFVTKSLLNVETKNQALIVIVLRCLGRLYSLMFCGYFIKHIDTSCTIIFKNFTAFWPTLATYDSPNRGTLRTLTYFGTIR